MGRTSRILTVALATVAAVQLATEATNAAEIVGTSADGESVVFLTAESMAPADDSPKADLYVRKGSETRLVSTGPYAQRDPKWTELDYGGISPDGKRIYFASDRQLVASDQDSRSDVYVRSGRKTRLLSKGDVNRTGKGRSLIDFATIRAGADSFGRGWFHFTRVPVNRSDPIVFETEDGLDRLDKDGKTDVYASTPSGTVLVSTTPTGDNADQAANLHSASEDGDAVLFTAKVSGSKGTERRAAFVNRGGLVTQVGPEYDEGEFRLIDFSADGSLVTIETELALMAGDADDSADIYAWSNGVFRLVAGEAFEPDYGGISPDGTRLFFSSDEPLVFADRDWMWDLYEWRTDGTLRLVADANTFYARPFFRSVSDDGSSVLFNDPYGSYSAADTDEDDDVYLARDGNATLITGDVPSDLYALQRAVSRDHAAVAFEVEERATTAAGNRDLFEFRDGQLFERTNWLSQGRAPQVSFSTPQDYSADGSTLFANTFRSLTAGDRDENGDGYAFRPGRGWKLITQR